MKKILLLLCLFICCDLGVRAQAAGTYNITVTAEESGSGITTALAELGVTDMTTVSDLTVNGSINSYDFEVMRDQMSNLTNLDLGNANVVDNSYAPNVVNDKYSNSEKDKFPIYALYAKTSLKSVVLPSGVTNIGSGAFRGCSSLSSIEIPASVTGIGGFAFNGCSSLTSVVIPEGVTSIGFGIFAGCNAIESISVAEGNAIYDSRNNCNAIIETQSNTLVMGCKNTVIPGNVTSIEYEAFREFSSLTAIDIPASVKSIGAKAFLGCSSLTSLVIPEGVKSIEEYTFKECSSLTSITIPESVTSIGYESFRSCSSLTSFAIPKSMTSIGDKVFIGCSSLTSIVIPTSVTSIGWNAFPRLKSITFESLEVPTMEYINAEVIYVHVSVLDAYRSALGSRDPNTIKAIEGEIVASGKYIINVTAEEAGSGIATVLREFGVTDMTTVTDLKVNGSINNYDFKVLCEQMTKLVNLDISNTDVAYIPSQAFIDHKSLKSVILPLEVTDIYSYAFKGCSSLNSVIIPESVTNIGDQVFYKCTSLPSIVLPSSVMGIGNYAFYDCSSLSSIVIPDSVTHIGNYVFYGCSSLSSIVIPDSVTHIGNYVFNGCSSLSSIVIPANVSNIGLYAFKDIDMVTIKAETVPTFDGTSLGCNSIFVPRKALEGYRAALSDHPTSSIMAIEDTHVFEVVVTAEQDASGLMTALAPFGLSEADNSLWNVFELKVSGTINSRDFMILRNKMINLRKLDLSETTIVYNEYEHYSGYHSENNILPAYAFAHSKLIECKLPANIMGMGVYAFYNCKQLKSIDITDGVTSVPNYAFYNCTKLESVNLPEGLVSIGSFTFCSTALADIKIPTGLKTIGSYAFRSTKLTEVHLPSSIELVGDEAFSTSTLKNVYTYIVEPVNINQNTFYSYTYADATLHIQETAFRNYYYDTQWSQFQKLASFNEPYEYFYLGKDFTIDAETPRLDGVTDEETGVVTPPDADMKPGSGLIVEGDESQDMDDVHLGSDGEDNSGSLVGEGTQDGNCNININKLHVDISVQPNRWYFFAFPFDVPLTNIAYEGNSVWRYYDGEHRANNGNGSWKNFKGETLEAWKGYIFHGSKKGTLTISFDAVKIDSEDRHVPLVKHESANDQDAGWNFVGNPYFNYFDINDLDYDQPITVWNGTSYETYRKGDDNHVLHPFEGYFVQKPDNMDEMHFDSKHRQTKIQSDAKTAALAPQRAAMRAANKERKLINLTISDGTTTDKTRVVFNERSRAAYEIACDAAKFLASGVPQLYSMDADNVSYSINERPEGNGIVALGYVANAKGGHTISVARADVNVMLYDKVADKAHYFTNGDYTFTTEAGTFNDRFQIIKTGDNDGATAINGVCTAGDAVIDMVEGKLLISNADGLNTTVTAINGAVIGTIAGNGSLKVQPGIYVVTVGSHSQKVMVK